MRRRSGSLLEGWHYLLRHPTLRPLLVNVLAVNGLIMATLPLVTFLMLGPLGFPPWEYGLAFSVPAIAGLVGARLARRLVVRYRQAGVLVTLGAVRAGWSLGLAFVRPGVIGLLIVMMTEFGLILSCSIFNPVLATFRLEHTDPSRLARVLSAWSVTTSASVAALTAAWGALAALTTPRSAIVVAGVLMLGTPLLLPTRRRLLATTDGTVVDDGGAVVDDERRASVGAG